MKITMYELLGLVKEDKEPKKIKYDGKIWLVDYALGDYTDNYQWLFEKYFKERSAKGFINDEVEILEEEKKAPTLNNIRESYGLPRIEEKKIPEKLNLDTYATIGTEVDKDVIIKINEVIDYLKSKEDE